MFMSWWSWGGYVPPLWMSGVFVAEVERITAWARREYAESNIHTYRWYTDKEHRKPYYKRDYALVTITDPVAQQLEKLIALVSKKH